MALNSGVQCAEGDASEKRTLENSSAKGGIIDALERLGGKLGGLHLCVSVW